MRHRFQRTIWVEVPDPVGTLPTVIIRLNNITSLRIVSLDKLWMAFNFNSGNELAIFVKKVAAEEHAKGVTARALPDAMTGTM
jgi:hypothetical protein